jgi:hypothetical protein
MDLKKLADSLEVLDRLDAGMRQQQETWTQEAFDAAMHRNWMQDQLESVVAALYDHAEKLADIGLDSGSVTRCAIAIELICSAEYHEKRKESDANAFVSPSVLDAVGGYQNVERDE